MRSAKEACLEPKLAVAAIQAAASSGTLLVLLNWYWLFGDTDLALTLRLFSLSAAAGTCILASLLRLADLGRLTAALCSLECFFLAPGFLA